MTQSVQNLSPVKVSDLLSGNFFIRSYQRGYRWSDAQVLNLLDDINNFSAQNRCAENQMPPWYCLQPLVVKEIDKQTKGACGLPVGERWYEVIDGQQRLTTIFLIIHYINEMWVGKSKMPEPNIRYETRPDSATFLREIAVQEDNTVSIDDANIDYNHISNAYKTIHSWAEKKKQERFDNNGFQSKFNEHTKVIWYEVAHTEDSIDVFTRLNMGKIRLTNAELIKALLLSEESIAKTNPEELRLKRLEIASEWDLIENQLNNLDFWSFVTNKKAADYPTKIELLLALALPESDLNDEFDLFNFYFSIWKKESNIKQLWEDIVADFEILKEWYSDHKLYHLVGYLIHQDTKASKLRELLGMWKKSSKQSFVSDVLMEQIKGLLAKVDINSISYDKNPSEIHRVLTLFNIITVMHSDGKMHRYPFLLHKGQGSWSLEHIHAQQSEGLNSVKEWRSWLGAHNEVLKGSSNSEWQDLSKQINDVLLVEDRLITKEVFEQFFEKVKQAMSEQDDREEVHSIENMALLGKDDNSALNNSMFAVKRRKILEMDQKGAYIPICTRNVFLKYYNKDATDYVFWSPKDRESYLEAIKQVLCDYLPQTINQPQAQ